MLILGVIWIFCLVFELESSIIFSFGLPSTGEKSDDFGRIFSDFFTVVVLNAITVWGRDSLIYFYGTNSGVIYLVFRFFNGGSCFATIILRF